MTVARANTRLAWFRVRGPFRCALALMALTAGVGLGCENPPPKAALGYSEGAKQAYDDAMKQFDAHQWADAQLMMRDVKRRFSYSKFARLAELRIADADYEQEKFTDAIREYKEFIHAHRSDEENVAYARSRIADATYAEIPDSLFMAATEERDQASVVDAYKELKAFLADYPTSKESGHARELLAKVTGRLIRHELYVARFYLARDNFDATVARVEYALQNYPELATAAGEEASLHAEALLLLGETYLKMHKWVDARHTFEALVRMHGRTPLAVQAQNYLTSMTARGV